MKKTWGGACNRVDRLYERIQNQGYQSKQELVQQDGLSPDKYVGGDRFNCYDEVVVDIGRDGQFLFVDGRHRLAIVKTIGIDEIPVRISARHKKWQRVRERVAETPRPELSKEIKQHLEHPDLNGVLEKKRNS